MDRVERAAESSDFGYTCHQKEFPKSFPQSTMDPDQKQRKESKSMMPGSIDIEIGPSMSGL